MSGISAFRDWLPVPTFRFVGGPADGLDKVVTLHESARGRGPPERWYVLDRPIEVVLKTPQQWADADPAEEQTYRVCTYRFVATGHWNAGYYEFVE